MTLDDMIKTERLVKKLIKQNQWPFKRTLVHEAWIVVPAKRKKRQPPTEELAPF